LHRQGNVGQKPRRLTPVILNPFDPSIHSSGQLRLLVKAASGKARRKRDALFDAGQLIRHGHYDDAVLIIDRLRGEAVANETFNLRLNRLATAAEQVHSVPNLRQLLGNAELVDQLLSVRSALLGGTEHVNHLLIVYSTAYNNFDISFPFLHCLVSPYADCILYVKNPERGMYTTGNHEFGSSIDEITLSICKLAYEISPSRISVAGFSGGGYAALHLAAMINAHTFLGFNIKTDWSRTSPFPVVGGRACPSVGDYSRNSLQNLRSMSEITSIQDAVLFYGDRDSSDKEHAENMAELPNFTLRKIETASHNIVVDLLIAGLLPGLFRTVLG